MKRFLLILISLTYVMATWAANIFSISTTDGNNGDEITVSAALTSTSDVSAAEFSIYLGPQLRYVDGTCAFNSDRLNGHTTSVNIDGDTLKVYVYSLSLSSIKTGEGELFSFKLKCGNEPGQYTLTPKVVLSDAKGDEVSSSVRSTSMTIYVGKVSVPSPLEFQKAFVGAENTVNLTIRNSGNKELIVSDIVSSCDWINVSKSQFSIEAGASQDIIVIANPSSKGLMQETLTIVSDAGNSEVIIPVIVNATRKNQIMLPDVISAEGGQPITIDVALENQEEVSAIEFSIDVPNGIEIVSNSCKTTTRTDGFSVYVSQKGKRFTVYLLSMTNRIITGTSGTVMSFDLVFNTGAGNFDLKISEVKILNKDGINIASEMETELQTDVKAPQLSVWRGDKLYLGYVPIGEEQDGMLQIRNLGNSELIISAIQSENKCCVVKEEFPIYISPNEDHKFRVTVKCDQVGDLFTPLTVVSNVPEHPEYKTLVTATIIDVNTLALSGELHDENKAFNMNVGMNNTKEISAVQMDIHCPEFVITNASNLVLSDRLAQTHQFSIAKLANNTYRVVIFSANNAAISGNTGTIFSLKFENTTTNTLQKSDFTINNVVIGNKQGENVCSIEHYGFHDVFYYTFSDPFFYNPEQGGIQSIVGTGTKFEHREEWVGEPVIMGDNDITVYRWTNPSDTMCCVKFYDEDGSTILTSKSVPSNYQIWSPKPPIKQGKVFYGWAVEENIVSNSSNYVFFVQSDIELKAIYTDKVDMSQTDVTLARGQEFYLHVECGDDGATVSGVNWTSSNEDVVTVSSWGAVTALEIGTANITAEIPGTGLSCTCNVTVVPDIFKLTYMVGDEIYSQVDMQYGETIAPLDAPTKEGHTFSGWSEVPATMPAHDVTVTGSFTANTYHLTYMVDGEVYSTSDVTYGSSLTAIDEPTKEGHTFSGWSEIPTTMPAHDVTVTGSFTVNTYHLTYTVDGEVYSTSDVTYGSSLTVIDEPVKEGHTFSGWSEVPATMPAHDVTITGSFTVNKYKLTYMVDGEVYSETEVEYGAEITPIDEPSREGETFSGWSEVPITMPARDVVITGTFATDSYRLTYIIDDEIHSQQYVAYGSSVTAIDEPVKEGYTFSGWSEVPATMPAHDVTITGSFTVNKYKLTYLVDGEVYNESEVEYGAEITPIEEPSHEGETFSGWSEMPATMPARDVVITGTFATDSYRLTYIIDDEIHSQQYVAYGSSITAIDEPVKEGHTFSGWSEVPATMPAHDVTVTGSFSVNTYHLTYTVDGEVYSTSDVTYGSSLTAIDEPVKEGYTFSGWSEVPITMPAHDVTVTGSFTINYYTVTYMYDGEIVNMATLMYGEEIPAYEYSPSNDDRYTYTFVKWVDENGEALELSTMPAYDITAIAEISVYDGIIDVSAASKHDVYTIQGIKVGTDVDVRTLPHGLYIIGGKKVMVK